MLPELSKKETPGLDGGQKIPDDPKECRQRAINCQRAAKDALTRQT